MNAAEAIKQLQQIKQDKQKREEFNTTKTMAESLNGLKNILVDTMVGLTKIIIGNQYPVTVKNFPKQPKIQDVVVKNFPKDNTAEEVKKMSEMMDKHHLEMKSEKSKEKHEELSPILKEISSRSESILLDLKSSKKSTSELGSSVESHLEALLKAVQSLKLNPKIEVKQPKIEIPAPIVNVPEVKIPKYPTEMKMSNFDLGEVVTKLEELVTEIQYSTKQPVTVANPGEFPVSFSIPSFVDVNGSIAQARLDASGFVIVSNSGLAKYELEDKITDGSVTYLGYTDNQSNWYILKVTKGTTASFRYASVENNPTKTLYSDAWSNYNSLTYGYYHEAFLI